MVRVRRASRVVLRIVSFAFLAVFSLFAGSSEARAQEPSPTTQASPTPEAPQSPQRLKHRKRHNRHNRHKASPNKNLTTKKSCRTSSAATFQVRVNLVLVRVVVPMATVKWFRI